MGVQERSFCTRIQGNDLLTSHIIPVAQSIYEL